jgi:hypothetical protein
MAEFTLNILDTDVPRVISGLCTYGGFIGADVTYANALQVVMSFISSTVASVESDAARQAAIDASVPVQLSGPT